MAHATEFGLLSLTVIHGVSGAYGGWRFDWALAALSIAVSYADLEEWHQ